MLAIRSTYQSGNAWFICDRCSQRWRRSRMQTEWDQLKVCPTCLDPRPPQMLPPEVYPEGLPFIDARSPQDHGDAYQDDTYLKSGEGGIGLSIGVVPVYANHQPSPIGALSPLDVTENPIPGGDIALEDDFGADVLDSSGGDIAGSEITQVAGAPPFPAIPGQTKFNPAAVLQDDIIIRTGPVFP